MFVANSWTSFIEGQGLSCGDILRCLSRVKDPNCGWFEKINEPRLVAVSECLIMMGMFFPFMHSPKATISLVLHKTWYRVRAKHDENVQNHA